MDEEVAQIPLILSSPKLTTPPLLAFFRVPYDKLTQE